MHKEIELTAEIDKRQFDALRKYFSKHLRHTASQKLFMVRFHKGSKLDQHNPLDVRYKWRNGIEKLVIKKGVLGSRSRKEFDIPLGKGSIESVLQLFLSLSYKTANCMYREIERFENKNVEAALGKAGPYYFIEVEALSERTNKEALAAVKNFFKTLKLVPLTKTEYHRFIYRLDQEVNFNFPLAQFPKPLMRSREWKKILEKTIFSN